MSLQSEGTKTNGGTSAILPAERKKATFSIDKMTNVIDGGEEKTKRRRFLLSPMKGVDLSERYFWGREEMLKNHVKHFIEVHEGYWENFIPTREDVAWMLEHAVLSGALMNHYGLFLATIAGQGSAEQKFWWGFTGLQCKIIGSYAQTELGHGSNVRGLQTTATFDKNSQEFILNTPTLRSMKWWPGALGKVATHTVVYAQLILDGKEYGPHPFVLQIRDENHKPLPGIELGDLGPKFGDHANDTGFMILNNVRIPREYLLSGHQEVTPEGKYVKGEVRSKNDKTHYATMMYTRGAMIKGASGYLARAVTIATRYSCVRVQGFANTAKGQSFKAEERQIIDYQVQKYRLLKALALTYAIKFTGKWMLNRFKDLEGTDGDPRSNQWAIQNAEALPEIAATSGALKALCTYLASQSIEDCRKCCGGNGYLLASGIASLSADYLWQTTAEGDWIILMLQTAKHLMGILKQIKSGEITKATAAVDYLAPLVENKNLDVDSPSFVKAHLPVARSWKDFLDLEFLYQLFKYNTLVSVVRAGKEMEENTRRLRSSGKTDAIEEESFNSTALIQVNAVRIHCFSFMLSNFIQEIQEVEDLSCRSALKDLCALYATSLILDDSQWIGIIGPDQYAMVKTATWHVLDAIRPNAVALVDAFDVPDNILNSAIGRYDGNVYEALYEAAKKSPLNKNQVFDGYKEYLRPHLDLELLKRGNKPPSKL